MNRIAFLAASMVIALATRLPAANYVWTAGGGATTTWSTAANWGGTVPPFAAGDTFSLNTLNITANSISTVDFNATLGTILIGDATTASNSWTLNRSGSAVLTLDNLGVAAQITQIATSNGDTISVPLNFVGNLNITNSVTATTAALANPRLLTISGGITGAGTGAQTILFNSTFTSAASNTTTFIAPTTVSGVIADGTGTVGISVQGGSTFTSGTTAQSAIQTVTLSGVNTFSGPVVVGAVGGTGLNYLVVGNSAALGNSTSITLNGVLHAGGTGSRLTLGNGVTISGKTLTMAPVGGRVSLLVDTNSTAAWLGNITVSGTGQNALYANGTSAIATIGTLGVHTITGTTTTLSLRGGAGGVGTINSTISLGTGGLTKTDAGLWAIASTGNTWANTAIAVGTIRTTVSNAVPATTIVTFGQNDTNTAFLDLFGTNQTIAQVMLNSTTASQTGAKTIQNTAATQATLTLDSATSYTTAALNGTVSPNPANLVITNNVRVVKNGTGVVTFNNANTFTGGLVINNGGITIASGTNTYGVGGVTVNGGTFTVNSAFTSSGGVTVAGGTFNPNIALAYTGGTTLTSGLIQPTGTGTLGNTSNALTVSGGTLDLNGLNQTVGNFSGTGGTVLNNGGAAATLTIGQGTALANTGSFAGTLADGISPLAITKVGAGTIALAGSANTYTGTTTVNAGTLNYAGTWNTATALTVARGAKFGLTGAPQTVNVSTLTLGTGATGQTLLGLQLGDPTIPAASDLIASNAVTAANPIRFDITALANFGATAGTPYTLLSAPNGGLSSATFSVGNFPSGYAYTLTPTDTLITLAVTVQPPSSGPIYWIGTTDASWATAPVGNAVNFTTDLAGTTPMFGSPNSTNTVIFSATNVNAANTITNTLDNNYTINNLVFNNETATGAVTSITIAPGLSATNTLTITPAAATDGVRVEAGAPTAMTVSAAITLGAAQTWTVTDAGTTFTSGGTLTGTTTLTLSGAGNVAINNAGTGFTGNIAAGSAQLTFGGTVATTITGIISGAALVSKVGTGALTLNGANTYTGNTVLTAGTLNLGNASAISTGSFTLAGGTFNNTSGAPMALPNNAQFWDGNFIYTGTQPLDMGNGAVAMSGSRLVTVNGTFQTVNTTAPLVQTGTLIVGGVISGTGSSLTKAGTGGLILTGLNTFTGGVTLNAGVLVANTIADGGLPSSLGAAPATTNITLSGGTLALTGANNITDRGLTIGAATRIILPTAGSTTTWNGALVGTGTLNIGDQNTVAGSTSTLRLTADNSSFTGGVQLSNGIVVITNSNALGSGTKAVNIQTNTTGFTSLRLDGSAGDINLPATFTHSVSSTAIDAGIVNVAGNNTVNGNFTLTTGNGATNFQSNAGTLTLTGILQANATGRFVLLRGNSSGVISGTIQDNGANTLGVQRLEGTGTWTLTGNNTYSVATTVSFGTLLVNGQTAPNSGTGTSVVNVTGSTVAVSNAGTFGGNGRAAGLVTVQNFTAPGTVGGTLRAGDATAVGTLELGGGLTVQPNGRLAFRITDATTTAFADTGLSSVGSAPTITSNNFLNITGGATTIDTGAVIAIDGTGTVFAPGTSYSYLVGQGAGAQTLSITAPAQFDITGVAIDPTSLSFTNPGTGNLYLNFTTIAVPEPALAGLGLLALLGLRRVRRAAHA